jgi:hypothetical protein
LARTTFLSSAAASSITIQFAKGAPRSSQACLPSEPGRWAQRLINHSDESSCCQGIPAFLPKADISRALSTDALSLARVGKRLGVKLIRTQRHWDWSPVKRRRKKL